jgi:HSP20 family molecular chaperone IbpA
MFFNNDKKYFSADDELEPTFEVELAKAKASGLTARSLKALQASPSGKRENWEGEPEGQLTVDVYQTPDAIVVESAIAGVRPEDIDINVTSESISIKGFRSHQDATGEKEYLYQECYWGRFARSIIFPQEIDPEDAEVTFKNGILTVRLPKISKRRTRKLQVRMD